MKISPVFSQLRYGCSILFNVGNISSILLSLYLSIIASLDRMNGLVDEFGWEVISVPLLDEVRDLVGDFYDGALTAPEFRERFASHFSQSHRYVSEIQDKLLDIDGMYADYIAGQVGETELKKRLFESLPSTRIQVPEAAQLSEIWKTPAATTQNTSPRLQSRPSPRPLQMIEIFSPHR